MIPTRRRRGQVMKDFGFSPNCMDDLTAGIRRHPERYPNGVIKSGRITLIDVEMLYDWIKYREALDMQVAVPPFRREEYQ